MGALVMGSQVDASKMPEETVDDSQCFTHTLKGAPSAEPFNLVTVKARVLQKIMNSPTPVSEEDQTALYSLVDDLAKFPFGESLLAQGGITGRWTHYMVYEHPRMGRWSGRNSLDEPLTTAEDWVLNKMPVMLATQQRFNIFQGILNKHLKDGAKFGSVPCGWMADLLTLPSLSHFQDVELVGMDIDSETLKEGEQYASSLSVSAKVSFKKQDALTLPVSADFDALTSNGLNFYMHNDNQVVQLYRSVFGALKSGGVFVTSFLTTPPIPKPDAPKSPWRMSGLKPEDLMKQRLLFQFLGTRMSAFRSEELTIAQLKEAGFDKIEIYPDDAYMMPTVVAYKN
jgi:SAM-dependent methyltransferase